MVVIQWPRLCLSTVLGNLAPWVTSVLQEGARNSSPPLSAFKNVQATSPETASSNVFKEGQSVQKQTEK